MRGNLSDLNILNHRLVGVFATSGIVGLVTMTSSMGRSETWDDVRTMALNSNSSLATSSIDLSVSEEKLRQSRSGFFPNVSATVSKINQIQTNPYDSFTSNKLSVSASQNLFAGFASKYAVERSEWSLETAKSQKKIESANVRSLLKKTFNYGLYLEESIQIARKALARRQENVRIVNLRYEGGRENKSSALKTEASKLSLEADLNSYVASLDIAKLELAKTIGTASNVITDFSGSLTLDRPMPDLGKKTNPRVSSVESDMKSFDAAIRETRSGWFPQLNFEASLSKSGEDQKLDGKPVYSLGLSLSMPLYEPNQSPKYRQSVLLFSKAQLKLADTIADVNLTVKKALVNLQDAKARLAIAIKLLEADNLQAEVYRQRYTLGMVSFQDWDTSESEFIKAEKDVLVAKRELADAWADLDQAIGRGLEEEGP